MFLPRQTPLQPAQRPSLASTGSSASASAISIQVHETLLAAKARDLSKECGLGLADENSDVAHYVDSDDQGQSVESGHILSSEPLGAGSKHSADHLFVGGHPGPEHHQRASIVTCDALKPKRHSTKRASLRGYAEVQWKRHEGLRDRVLRATDVAKLEWEAKAALLHHSYPLAILLLFRAASLGSASACEQLANLYALGVTRGIFPAVTLVYRDTLRSLAWILEALRLYERRLAAQIRAANLSTTPSLRLAQIWQGPLKAAQLLVGGLLSSDVAAFDPCQKNAVFLPVIDDLTDSQCAWSLRSSQNSTQSARQAPELWTELEDAIQRWTARLEAERTSASYDALILRGPDEVEEHQGLAAIVQNLNFHLCVLRAIQMTRFLILEPYAENIEPVEIAWTKAAQVKPEEATNCPDPALMLDVLSRAKGKSGRLYDEQLFRDLSGCVSTRLDGPIATEYKLRNFQAFERTRIGASEAKDKNRSPHVATQTKDRLRDLVPADVETAKQMDESTRPSLTMRLSSSHAAPQAAVVSISASGEHQTPMPSGVSASKAVRQKYGRSVSSSMASASSKAEPRASETASPSGSVRTGYSLSAARPRRPSSVVSVTPSLLFPPEISQDSRDRVGLASDENFPPGPSYRARSASSSHFASTSGIPRPRVSSMYSSAPVLVPSTSSIGLLPPSVSTTSQQNLNALASTNSTPLSVPSRRRTGSNASLASLNPRLVSILPKTSPSISEGPEASISSSSISKPVDVTAENPATKQSAAADTLRRLKGRRSYTDLHTFHSARNDPRPAPPMPSIPPAFAGLTSPGAPRPSTLQHSKSTVFVSMENLPDDIPSESKDSADKVSRNGTESVGSAMEHLARTQARISHQLIPSVLEEAEAKAATVREARPGPPFMSALAAGALSGLTVDLLFFPIDTIKTRLQSAQGFWAAGGFSGVYRGLASTAVGSAPGASVFFTTYESMKPALVRWMPGVFGSDGALGPAGVHMASASIAEVAACLIRVPTEVIKSRQQTMTYGKGTTTFQAFMKVFHEAGVRGYYRGFGSTVGREIPFTCIQFPLYERLKLEMARSRERSQTISLEAGDCPRSVSDQELVRNLPTWQAGLAGSIAGAIAAGLTTPLDVVKTRIMLHTKQSAAVSPASSAAAAVGEALPLGVNTSIIPTLLHIGRTEGIKTLFSGFLPRTMWIGLGGAVFLGTFDAGIKVLS